MSYARIYFGTKTNYEQEVEELKKLVTWNKEKMPHKSFSELHNYDTRIFPSSAKWTSCVSPFYGLKLSKIFI